ncbi:MAG: tRNA guanosine(34) transglycosylase Tgt [Bacteroidales bacterium]|nr:tRNA guanosine(34) transglycosylase Tgt [Bacteroidales bacterium]MCF8389296.1 tRNA guanosine(34) transglycosylase Tgt [Bacteroidales bacterium]
MEFTISNKDGKSKARAGLLRTDHGDIQTPIFMPVGTGGSVKGVHQRELKEEIQAPVILGNTYHLYLRPGNDVLRKAGGLHKFINWDGAILTDSGGYQVFSLSEIRKIKEEGAVFQSHIDGSKHIFSPENNVETQRIIGADIIMALDECTPYPCDYNYARKSLDLTHRWLDRGIKKFYETEPLYGHNQAYFPIVQGSVYKDLRKESAEFIAGKGMDGNAIGGLSVGEPAEEMYAMTDIVTDILPESKPRYLMGVGTPVNILESIALGVDMFDCVMPTRNGRNGMLFTSEGIINIKNVKWKEDFSSLDPNVNSFVDIQYSKAYLRHLIISNEMLGAQIATIHNLAFYLWLVKTAREKIVTGEFSTWKNQMVKKLSERL